MIRRLLDSPPTTVTSFEGFTSTEQTEAFQALGEWSTASGLTFVEVAPGQGDINFQNVDFDTTNDPSYAGAGGIGFYPFGDWSNLSYPNYTGDLDASGRRVHEYPIHLRRLGELRHAVA